MFLWYRNYKSSDIKQACDSADLAIVCLGTGVVYYTKAEQLNFIQAYTIR